MPKGNGGQFGAQVAFSPDGQYLFLTVGDRQRMTPAQDPNTEVGKILRLTLDGKPAPGNPKAGKTGATTRNLIAPQRFPVRDVEVAADGALWLLHDATAGGLYASHQSDGAEITLCR